VIDRALETHIANEERLLQPLSPADRRTLDKLLRRLLADLDSSTADASTTGSSSRPSSVSS
jgi:hypothetical protein